LKARVGDYWYLHCRDSYTLLDIIFSYIGDRICIHYYAVSSYYGRNITKVIKYSLNEIEQREIVMLIEKATEIFEVNDRTLKETQVYGAEYH
jgi:hypothetical protein